MLILFLSVNNIRTEYFDVMVLQTGKSGISSPTTDHFLPKFSTSLLGFRWIQTQEAVVSSRNSRYLESRHRNEELLDFIKLLFPYVLEDLWLWESEDVEPLRDHTGGR